MEDEHVSSFAERLERLFAAVHAPGAGPYTNAEVVRTLWASGGPSITQQYLSQLRKGERTNPTKDVIEGLARFFNVPPAYFFDSALSTKIAEELEFLAGMRDAGVRELALRAAELSPQSIATVTAIMGHIRDLELKGGHGDDASGVGG